LYGLAVEGKAPKIFRKVNRMGVPWPALCLCTAFCFLVFLNIPKSASKVFNYFVSLVSTFGATTWSESDITILVRVPDKPLLVCILYTHIRFMRGLAAQGISRDTLPYKAPLQPYGAWIALISTMIIGFFKGFDAFMPFQADTFVTSYIGFPVFALLAIFWKLLHRETKVDYKTMDFLTGKREIDLEEEAYAQAQTLLGPRTWKQKLWDSL
jgi:amino acid transporter